MGSYQDSCGYEDSIGFLYGWEREIISLNEQVFGWGGWGGVGGKLSGNMLYIFPGRDRSLSPLAFVLQTPLSMEIATYENPMILSTYY